LSSKAAGEPPWSWDENQDLKFPVRSHGKVIFMAISRRNLLQSLSALGALSVTAEPTAPMSANVQGDPVGSFSELRAVPADSDNASGPGRVLIRTDHSNPHLAGATIYTSLEPCSKRASRPTTCTQWILTSGVTRVVLAWREPALFVADCQGVELLTEAGLTVVELAELAQEAKEVNKHLKL
jgi:pyrimidine deaminase RibD-like protein